MTRKINKARRLTVHGHYPETFADCIAAIPPAIIAALTAKELAALINANQKIYAAGAEYAQKEINDFLGVDFWSIAWSNIDIDDLPCR